MRKSFLCVVFAVLALPGVALTQWDVKWHSTQDRDITGCEVIQSGFFDNSRVQSLVACLSEKTGDEIAIIDGSTGEIRWRSEQYYKIFKESIHVSDFDGSGKDEIAFAAQNTPKSSVALYLIAASGKSFAQTMRTDPPPPADKKQDPIQAPSVQPAASQSASLKSTNSQSPPSQTTPSRMSPGTSPAQDPPHTLPSGMVADIPYQVSSADSVSIAIYDGTGTLVRILLDATSPAGSFVKTWDGTDDSGARVAVGPYFYTVTIGKTTEARKKVSFR